VFSAFRSRKAHDQYATLHTSDKGKYYKVKSADGINDELEKHQMALSAMKNSPYYLTFAKGINHWVRSLNEIAEIIEMMTTVQRSWMYLESIFMESVDIRKQLPTESTQFEGVNSSWIR
jgi:hypothetical protein